MRARKFDIVGIGENATDTMMILPHFPDFDSSLEARSIRVLPGGQVATAMIACRRWGLRTRYVGAVGDDPAANLHRESLRRAGVRAELLTVRDCASQQSLIFINAESGERTIMWNRDSRLSLRARHLRRDWFTSARLLHIDGHDPDTKRIAAQWARAANVLVVADFDPLIPGLHKLLPWVDYPVTSKRFALSASGEKSLLRALPMLKKKYGFHSICTTLGAGGAIAWDGLRFWYSRSYRVRVVDSTGAGDLFRAGFAYGILQAWDCQRVLDFSCAAGGLNCTALGARGGIGSLRAVEGLRLRGRRNPPLFSRVALDRAARVHI